MLSSILDHRRIRQLITLVLILCVLICMFPPEEAFYQQFAAHNVHIAVGMVGLGLVFLITDKIRLMFVCFGCSAAICFFKNETALRQQLSKVPSIGHIIDNVCEHEISSAVFDFTKNECTQTTT